MFGNTENGKRKTENRKCLNILKRARCYVVATVSVWFVLCGTLNSFNALLLAAFCCYLFFFSLLHPLQLVIRSFCNCLMLFEKHRCFYSSFFIFFSYIVIIIISCIVVCMLCLCFSGNLFCDILALFGYLLFISLFC